MANDVKRTPVGPAKQEQLSWNGDSNSRRVCEVGHDFFSPGSILGELSAAHLVPSHRSILVYNSDVAVQFIAFGDAAVAVTGPTDGVPVAPGAYVIFSSGDNTYVISSANTVYGFVAKE
jgi:hypothetical protein